MDIKIEAIGHPNQDQLSSYYTEILTKKYGRYPFVKIIDVKVTTQDELSEVKLMVQLEKAGKVFSSDRNVNENKSLQGAIKKMNTQIEKYKEKHYA